ncbi:hypothetical protein ACVDFE_12695 [Lentzea chajnantorensis]
MAAATVVQARSCGPSKSSTCEPNRTAVKPEIISERSMSARIACPSSTASVTATSTPNSSTSSPIAGNATAVGTQSSRNAAAESANITPTSEK